MILVLLACTAKKNTPDPDDPFPLIEGLSWRYDATFHGREMIEEKVLVPFKIDGSTAYAFLAPDDLSSEAVIISSSMFGLGMYRRVGDQLQTAEAGWRSEISEVTSDDFQPMLDLPPRLGAAVTWETDNADRSGVTVAGLETITVPAGTFRDTVRLELGQGSTAWLAPGVGVVKWVLVTGRVEELVEYSLQ